MGQIRVIIGLTLLLIGGGSWLVFNEVEESNSYLAPSSLNKNIKPEFAELVVNQQIVDDVITIAKVKLNEPGYLVVREIIDDKAGQIIEISSYLEVGEYSNLEISLGDFYEGNKELMVLVYKDNQNDKVLNDLDQPITDDEGNFIARYAATGEIVPNTVVQNDLDTMQVDMMMGGMKMETVRYTNAGFEPSLLEVSVGTMVQFVNEREVPMWVASDDHPAHDVLPTFDQFKPNDNFSYVFEKKGVWSYHDHLNAAVIGKIIVN